MNKYIFSLVVFWIAYVIAFYFDVFENLETGMLISLGYVWGILIAEANK